jgi:hypothetical protein
VETGPIWPPASLPSITSASAPERNSFFASDGGAKTMTLAPKALIASTLPLGDAAGQHDMAHAMLFTHRDQIEQQRVHGDQVDAERLGGERLVPAISASSSAGVIAPQAITPKPPALLIAATRFRSETQLIAPHRIACSVPRKAAPRAISAEVLGVAVMCEKSPRLR